MLGKLKVLDAYPKINEDFFTKTFSGGIITIVSSVIMVLLFLSELGEAEWRKQKRASKGRSLMMNRCLPPQRCTSSRRACTS